jgi:hypothetical protein
MTTLHVSPRMASSLSAPIPGQLETEAAELEALNAGLKRHVMAWRTAHDSAVTHVTDLLKRMDDILERAERNLA